VERLRRRFTGYVEASAIADALGKKYGTRVRLQPSGTSIGRILTLKQKRVAYAWLANELFFAAEGLYEFGQPDWGPQDLRVMLGRVNGFSVVVTKTSGIQSVADLKGKRFAFVPANSSVNIKLDGIFAFAGLTWKDVQVVPFASYAASLKALVEGKADAAAHRRAVPGCNPGQRHRLGAAAGRQCGRMGGGRRRCRSWSRSATPSVPASPRPIRPRHGLPLPDGDDLRRCLRRRGLRGDQGDHRHYDSTRTPTRSCRAGTSPSRGRRRWMPPSTTAPSGP
jgi:hypothetical protein